MVYIENHEIALIRYSHKDDKDMFECWSDIDTQKGFNYVMNESFEEFRQFNIDEYRFWATIILKETECPIGTIRLSCDMENPDLAIWIYRPYRNRGYGTKAFSLALEYCFTEFNLKEIVAGCYEDNSNSKKMLTTLGFVRDKGKDSVEKNGFTGKETVQLAYRIYRDMCTAHRK